MDKIPYLRKDNFYTNSELSLIMRELNYLTADNVILSDDILESGASSTEMTTKKALWFTDLYREQHYSPTWRLADKIFQGATGELYDLSPINRTMLDTNDYGILLSYYENDGYYKRHHDECHFTGLLWFCNQPQRFTGGDLIFNDTNEVVKFSNNTLILFPSWADHEVVPVKLDAQYENKQMGRFCISMFLQIKEKN